MTLVPDFLRMRDKVFLHKINKSIHFCVPPILKVIVKTLSTFWKNFPFKRF